MRTMLKGVAVVSMAASALLVAGSAQAADSLDDYGQHVRVCAQTMGFDGMHNPGMHEGITGWDPSHTCPMG